MSIHGNNLERLMNNLENPDIFNLHLENPKEIMSEIFRKDDLESFYRIHFHFIDFDILYFGKDFRFCLNLLYSIETIPINILTYIVKNLCTYDQIDYFIHYIEIHNHRFNYLEQQIMAYWLFTKHEMLLEEYESVLDPESKDVLLHNIKIEYIIKHIKRKNLQNMFIKDEELKYEQIIKQYYDWKDDLHKYVSQEE